MNFEISELTAMGYTTIQRRLNFFESCCTQNMESNILMIIDGCCKTVNKYPMIVFVEPIGTFILYPEEAIDLASEKLGYDKLEDFTDFSMSDSWIWFDEKHPPKDGSDFLSYSSDVGTVSIVYWNEDKEAFCLSDGGELLNYNIIAWMAIESPRKIG